MGGLITRLLTKARPVFDAWPSAWQQCYAAYLTYIYDYSGSLASLRSYGGMLRYFFRDEKRLPSDYSRADVLSFIQSPCFGKRNHGKPVSASTRNFRQAVLTSFYKFASTYEVERGVSLYQGAMPTQGLRYLKRPIQYRAMNADELTRFFSAIPTDTARGLRDRALFWCYFVTTRRRAEIANLRWGDIEPVTFEDRRPGYVYRFFSKGKSRQIRTCELPGSAYSAIVRYLEVSGRLSCIKSDDPVFVATPGYGRKANAPLHPMNLDNLNGIFKKYARHAGLDEKRISLHSLRHTAIQERIRAGEALLDIMAVTGHSSLDAFYHYAQVLVGAEDPGAAKIEARFGHLVH